MPPPAKKKRGQCKSYSLAFKLAVVRDLYETEASTSETASKYNLPRSTVDSWDCQLRRKNVKVFPQKKGVHLRSGSGETLSYLKEIEEVLVKWILVRRDHHLPLGTQMIRAKATSLIKVHNPGFKDG